MSLWDAFKNFPRMLFAVMTGMLVAALSSSEGILFLILGILVGLAADNAWVGAAVAWGLYAWLYTVNLQRGQVVQPLTSRFDALLRIMNK